MWAKAGSANIYAGETKKKKQQANDACIYMSFFKIWRGNEYHNMLIIYNFQFFKTVKGKHESWLKQLLRFD